MRVEEWWRETWSLPHLVVRGHDGGEAIDFLPSFLDQLVVVLGPLAQAGNSGNFALCVFELVSEHGVCIEQIFIGAV